MITQFEVTNFRCIESLSLAHLGRINLITGKNGAGKTSLLEALWLLSGSDTPVLGLRIDSFRGLRFLPSRGPFRNLFFRFDPALTIEMFSEGDKAYVPRRLEIWLRNRPVAEEVPFNGNDPSGVEQLTSSMPGSEQEILFRSHLKGGRVYESRAWLGSEIIEGHVQSNAIQQEKAEVPGRANSIFLASQFRETPDITANRFGFYQTAGRVQDVVKVLTQLEPRLTGLIPVVMEDTALMHAQFEDEDKPVPIELLGEGTNRLLSLALAFRQAKGGFLLVDEIDNGLHYSVQAGVFERLFDLSQAYDVQVFATTHSAECIYAAHQALGDLEQGDFAFFRLDRGRKDAVYFDNKMLDTARAFALEIR